VSGVNPIILAFSMNNMIRLLCVATAWGDSLPDLFIGGVNVMRFMGLLIESPTGSIFNFFVLGHDQYAIIKKTLRINQEY